MKKLGAIGLFLIALVACPSYADKAPNDADVDKLPALVLYVAPVGNDAWTGTLAKPNTGCTDGPFATLERARDELGSSALYTIGWIPCWCA